MRTGFFLVLGAATAAVCNKPCLDLCLPFHSESRCFEQCGCKGATAFPAQIVTEDGRRFAVAPVPPQGPGFNDEYLGCKVECAEICFRYTSGYAQLNCVFGHCGCGALVTEVFAPTPYTPPPQPSPIPYAPAPQSAPTPYAPTPQPAPTAYAPAPQPAPTAYAPAPQPAPTAYAPAPQPAPATQNSVRIPFITQDGRAYEIVPQVSESVFFQSCAPCVDSCSRLTNLQLVQKCLSFCTCLTSVVEVPRRF